MPTMQVFVSHAHADNQLCDRYVEALKKRGLDVWYDRTNMQDGHFLSDQISEELERRKAFIVLVTPASLSSYYVKLETDAYRALAAQDRTRMFLPVRVAECKMPVLMAGIKWVDAVSLGFDAAVDAMAVALGAPAATQPVVTPKPVPAEGLRGRVPFQWRSTEEEEVPTPLFLAAEAEVGRQPTESVDELVK